jgi:PEP-CTERM motif
MSGLTQRLARSLSILPAVAGLLFLLAPAAHANDISFLDTFGNISYEQTGNGPSLTLIGTFFSADLNSIDPNFYTSASFTPPGGSPTALTATSGSTDYHFQTALFSNLAAMQTAYPFGTYTFSGTNGGTDTATLDYTANDYASTIPFLTGTDYSSLQGMNASQAFSFTLSPFTPGTANAGSFLFFTITDITTNTTVFNEGFLPSTTNSIFLPGGTLTAGDSYDYEIDDSDRDDVSGTGAPNDPQLGFDVRTDGTFTTAPAVAAVTPEPSSLILLGTGILCLATLIRRRLA